MLFGAPLLCSFICGGRAPCALLRQRRATLLSRVCKEQAPGGGSEVCRYVLPFAAQRKMAPCFFVVSLSSLLKMSSVTAAWKAAPSSPPPPPPPPLLRPSFPRPFTPPVFCRRCEVTPRAGGVRDTPVAASRRARQRALPRQRQRNTAAGAASPDVPAARARQALSAVVELQLIALL